MRPHSRIRDMARKYDKRGKITPKQEVFVREYLVDLNASGAALRAGYKNKNSGGDLLLRPEVQAAVMAAKAERANRLQITADNVMRELARIAFSDMADFVEWDADGVRLKSSSELDDDTRRAVQEISETTTVHGGSRRIKLYDKRAALIDLAKHLGLLSERSAFNGRVIIEWDDSEE